MVSTPTVVLVHGAFADASGYAGVIRELQARSVQVRAPMNPLRSLAFDADAIARYTTTIDGPIILVGHSYGGRYDAPGPPCGPDLFIKIADFHQTFCADLPAEVAAPMAVSQRPLSAAALTEKATIAGWKDLPTWYMLCEQDNAIPPGCQRFMAKRMNADVESVHEGSHAAFVGRPDIAASLILRAIATTRGPI